MRNYLFDKYKQRLPENIAGYLSKKLNKEVFPENVIPCSEGCNTCGYKVDNDYIVRFALNEKTL